LERRKNHPQLLEARRSQIQVNQEQIPVSLISFSIGLKSSKKSNEKKKEVKNIFYLFVLAFNVGQIYDPPGIEALLAGMFDDLLCMFCSTW
jgi:hypothetical protein